MYQQNTLSTTEDINFHKIITICFQNDNLHQNKGFNPSNVTINQFHP